MKCGGYYLICQNKAKPIIHIGSGKYKMSLCLPCAEKYKETRNVEEKKAIEIVILTHKAINKFIEKEKNA